MKHAFHIPVLGLAFSIDSPLKVAKFGISSVMSIVDDELIERARAYHTPENELYYNPIKKTEEDYRAKRITAYLNLVQQIVDTQIFRIKNEDFTAESDLTKYFEFCPFLSVPAQIQLIFMRHTPSVKWQIIYMVVIHRHCMIDLLFF